MASAVVGVPKLPHACRLGRGEPKHGGLCFGLLLVVLRCKRRSHSERWGASKGFGGGACSNICLLEPQQMVPLLLLSVLLLLLL